MAVVEQQIAPTTSSYGSCVMMPPVQEVELPKLVCAGLGVHGMQSEGVMCGGPSLVSCKHESSVVSASEGGRVRLKTYPNSDSKLHTKPTVHHVHVGPNSGVTVTSTTISGEAESSRAPSCRRRLLAEFERELTFKPKLNDYSLKIAAKNARSSVPVVHRLLERRSNHPHFQENLTFAPKLNALSLKLAQERASRMPEVHARMAQLAAVRAAEVYTQYTFRPQVSGKSLRIAESLGTSFLSRQQLHLQRRQKTLDEALKSPPRELFRPRRLIRLVPRPHPSPSTGNQGTDTSRSAASPSTSTSDTEDKKSDSSPDNKSSHHPDSPLHTSHPHTLSLHSPSGSIPKPTSPQKHHRRRSRSSSAPSTPSPDKPRRRNATSPQSKTPVTVGGSLHTRFKELSEVDRMKRVRVMAERITKAKKVFLCKGGYRMIGRCLRKRGWVEKDYSRIPALGARVHSHRKGAVGRSLGDVSSDSDSDVADLGDQGSEEEYSDEEEYCMLSRAVRNSVPHFVWTLRRDDILYRSLSKETTVNHFAQASSFTTKVGLCTNLRNLRWFGDTDPNTFYPRCYRLSCDEEKEAFIDDYRFTTALNVLKVASEQLSQPADSQPFTVNRELALQHRADTTSPPPTNHESPADPSRPGSKVGGGSHAPSRASSRCSSVLPRPVVPEETVRLAIKACEHFLSSRDHDDIEGSQYMLCPRLTDEEWNALIQHFYSVTFEDAQIMCGYHLVSRGRQILEEMEEHFPQLQMDGTHNIWIVKPGALSRGRGILCLDRLESILELVSSQVQKKENKWVIQKYIERPLLIYGTKFDIRQWFLVTDWNPLTMWMFKDCYLRFSTQPYTLDNLDQSIHLCNNSIQKHYENSSSRSDRLPEENMWDNSTFKEYLQSLGAGDKWDSLIYPGMKQALVHVLQVTQDAIEYRKNSFELYGADFMISEDFKPWLIEINCSPTMEASTAITTRMCKQVMEDTIKVVIDRREDKNCDTGFFELAFKQPKLEVPAYVGIQLCVSGSAIPRASRDSTAQRKTNTVPVVKLSYKSTGTG